MEFLEPLFRWFHIFWGIVWIGLLYFFNFVNGPFVGTMDPDTKKKVVPELMPRALFWFRWGAAWTWTLGLLLLMVEFYMGGIMFDAPNTWSTGAYAMIALVFIAPFLYDMIAKMVKDNRVMAGLGFVLIPSVAWLMMNVGLFGYRATMIHVGALVGTIMAYNVWFRIWPAQKIIINGVKNGPAADASVVALAGTRSKHNTYMSVPLLFTMINAHTVVPAASNPLLYLVIVLFIGGMAAFGIYKRAAKIKGF